MTLYAESSAVLAWLLGEERGEDVASALAGADIVFSSVLTLVECDRTLVRAHVVNRISKAQVSSIKKVLAVAASRWAVLSMDDAVVERARKPFPHEPIRTLDALHLASALEVRKAVPELEILSLDERVRTSAVSAGFSCLP